MTGYPRKDLCLGCQRVEVDVIGPGDSWPLCHLCHLALQDETQILLAEALGHEEAYMRFMLEDPGMSDDAIADAVLVLRRARGEQPLVVI